MLKIIVLMLCKGGVYVPIANTNSGSLPDSFTESTGYSVLKERNATVFYHIGSTCSIVCVMRYSWFENPPNPIVENYS